MSGIKRSIKNLIFSSYCKLFRVKNKNIQYQFEPHSIIILPGSSPGAVGDEAILIGMIDWLRNNKNIERIALINHQDSDRWENIKDIKETIPVPTFKNNNWVTFINKIGKYSNFYLNGTDVLDGKYSIERSLNRIDYAVIAYKLGLNVTITGFSFRSNAPSIIIKALRKLPKNIRLCSRDIESHRRLKRVLDRPVELTADVAFLLKPDYNSNFVRQINNWVKENRDDKRIIVGINANVQVLDIEPESAQKLIVDVNANCIKMLYEWNNNLCFLLIPHDNRGKYSDIYLSKMIYENLPHNVRQHCKYIDSLRSAKEIKGIVSSLDVVITGRMHLAIACLGQGVPVGSVSYQDKFDGLYKHFGLEGMFIEANEKLIFQDQLYRLAKRIIMDRKAIKEKIISKIPEITLLAEKNLICKNDPDNKKHIK